MFLKRAVIENFRKLKHLVIEAHGNHIVVSGPNGVGKSTIFETLMTVLGGKKYLMPDAVARGEEEARIEWEISEGNNTATVFKVAGRIAAGNDLKLTVTAFTPGGLELDVKKKPQELLEKLAPKEFIDPESFRKKTGAERIAMLYKLIPGLQGAINALVALYEAEQFKRSQINQDIRRLEGELAMNPITEGVEEKEVDAADLLEELKSAEEHNSKKLILGQKAGELIGAIKDTSEMGIQVQEEIEALQKMIVEKQEMLSKIRVQIVEMGKEKELAEKDIVEFKLQDTEEINTRIRNLNVTNEAIRKNLKNAELKKQIDSKKEAFSAGLEKMKSIDKKKVEVYKNSKMPVAGLTVGDTDIMYPDPVTGEVMTFAQLSTGQQCRAAVAILAPFLPAADQGLRCMLIADAESLDEKNYAAVLEAAEENGIQLVLHKTTWAAEDQKLEIIIEERK